MWVSFEHSSGGWTYRIKLWQPRVPGQVTGLQQSALCASPQPLARQKLRPRERGWHFLQRSVRSRSQSDLQCKLWTPQRIYTYLPLASFYKPSLRLIFIFGIPYAITMTLSYWTKAAFTVREGTLTWYRTESEVHPLRHCYQINR